MFDLKKLIAAVSFVTLGLSASAVMAQDGAPQQTNTAPAQQQEQASVSDTELRQFMSASVEVSKIREDYTERFNNAKDEPIAQQLQQEAQDAMLAAVEASGLDATRYNELSESIQSSPELQARLKKME